MCRTFIPRANAAVRHGRGISPMRLIIDQILSNPEPSDPLTEEALRIEGFLRECGVESRILADRRAGAVSSLPTAYLAKRKPDAVIYHHQFNSYATELLARADCEIVLRYHAVEPPELFRGFDSRVAQEHFLARRNIVRLQERTRIALAETQSSADELRSIGFRDTYVMHPITANPCSDRAVPVKDHPPPKSRIRVIFVGRHTPGQRVEDVIKAWIHFRHSSRIRTDLYLIAESSRCRQYLDWLERIIGMTYPEQIHLERTSNPNRIWDALRGSHIFLSMSEYEDFCWPMVDSMLSGLPVVAYECPGVQDTMEQTGVHVRSKAFDAISQTIKLLERDPRLCESVTKAQTEHVEKFMKSGRKNFGFLEEFLKGI